MSLELTDFVYERDKAWIEYDDETKFFIAYSSTDEQEVNMQKLIRKKGFRRTSLEDVNMIHITCQWLAKHILIDWEGVTKDGKPIEPTYENKYELLRKAKDVRDWISNEARDISNFKAEQDDLKNSKSGESTD